MEFKNTFFYINISNIVSTCRIYLEKFDINCEFYFSQMWKVCKNLFLWYKLLVFFGKNRVDEAQSSNILKSFEFLNSFIKRQVSCILLLWTIFEKPINKLKWLRIYTRGGNYSGHRGIQLFRIHLGANDGATGVILDHQIWTSSLENRSSSSLTVWFF